MNDTTNAIELSTDVQQQYDACLRDSRKTQKSLDNANAKADKGWRATLFALAQNADSFPQFEGYCNQAAANVKGDKPKVWTQAQSDIKGAWNDNDLNPADFKTLEALRRAKIDANKAKKQAENAAVEDKPALQIPAQLAAQIEAVTALAAACHESDLEATAAVLDQAFAEMLVIRDGEKKLKIA